MSSQLSDHIIELELRLQTPYTRADAAALVELLSAEFREFGASGRVWDRAGIIAELGTEVPHACVSESFECKSLSEELVLLTYVATNRDRKTLRSSLWRLEQDRWRLLFHQGTLIPPAVSKA